MILYFHLYEEHSALRQVSTLPHRKPYGLTVPPLGCTPLMLWSEQAPLEWFSAEKLLDSFSVKEKKQKDYRQM